MASIVNKLSRKSLKFRRLIITFPENIAARLNHFLLNEKLSGRLAEPELNKHVRGWKGTIDHAPVWIELEDNDLPPRKQYESKAESLEKQIEQAETGTDFKQFQAADLQAQQKDAPKSKIY